MSLPLLGRRPPVRSGRIPPSRGYRVFQAVNAVILTLVVVVTLKYHVYVLRADNRGEGGILALMALVRGKLGRKGGVLVVTLGLFGAALLYADGILTPAISVLGALEGLTVLAPELGRFVVPASVALLFALFAFQRRGTAGVGSVFGPIMLIWFVTLAILGVAGILRQPSVLAAVNPTHGARFLLEGGGSAFLLLGAVFLVRRAARLCSRTSGTSASGRSRSTGSVWSGSRSCSIISDRGRWSSPIRRPPKIRSSGSLRSRFGCRS